MFLDVLNCGHPVTAGCAILSTLWYAFVIISIYLAVSLMGFLSGAGVFYFARLSERRHVAMQTTPPPASSSDAGHPAPPAPPAPKGTADCDLSEWHAISIDD
ncbi:g1025 [Coccomyxa elongata]